MASVSRDQELPPYQTEPVPASSKTDPLLPKAELLGEAVGASVIMYL